jgi:hypothetical protein
MRYAVEELIFGNYLPEMFDALPQFHLARDELEQHRRAIDEIGKIICAHGFEDVLGINLLHKHFELRSDEIIVRSFIDDSECRMRPEPLSAAESWAIPYLWRYAELDGAWSWRPLEFLAVNATLPVDYLMLSYASPLLRRIGEHLVSQRLQDTFGIAGLYSKQGFRQRKGLTTLETTDEANRVLTVKSVPTAAIDVLEDTTETLWVFSRNQAREKYRA